LLAGAGLALDQDGGIGGSDSRHLLQYFAKLIRRTDDLLEHRGAHDLLAQRDGFVSDALFGLLAIFNVSGRGEPPLNLAPFVAQRIVAKEKPAIPPILAQQPLFHLKRSSHGQAAVSLSRHSLEIVWM